MVIRALLLFFLWGTPLLAATPQKSVPQISPATESVQKSDQSSLWSTLKARVVKDPLNLVATAIFFLAICHTFLASKFLALSHRFQNQFNQLEREGEPSTMRRRDSLRLRATLCHFLGEVEAIFGIWAIPLAGAILIFHGWDAMVGYFNGVNYTEPVFVFVIMAVAGSKPVLRFAESCLSFVAGLGRSTPAAWWLSILTLGPLLGSFITEPAAMTICALLLLERFYKLNPSMQLRYATLGLLFVNISVGGTLTHFAAPPVVMVADKWGWDMLFMFQHFGWKVILGILCSNLLFFAVFRRELLGLTVCGDAGEKKTRVPVFITVVHLLTIAWTVLNAHSTALVIFGLLFFLAFVVATGRHQYTIALRAPMLVGFFLAALVIHGGWQRWWLEPILSGLGEWPLMLGATALTAVNDNAAITYLATLVPGLTEPLKFAVVAGAVTGGGLTVIANAPNPAGQSILSSQFGQNGIKPLSLFLAAIIPTLIMGAALMLLG